jgi:hypothetical protein
MSLFQRLFRQTTKQPALPSDVLLSLLLSKIAAEDSGSKAFGYDSFCSSFAAYSYRCELPSGQWLTFEVCYDPERKPKHFSPEVQVGWMPCTA